MYRNLRTKASLAKTNIALVVGVHDQTGKTDKTDKTTKLPQGYEALDKQTGGAITQAIARPEFCAAKGAVNTAYPQGKKNKGFDRVYIVGLGKDESETGEALRNAAGRVLKMAFAAKITSLQIALVDGLHKKTDLALAGRALGDGFAIANFSFDTFKGKANKPDVTPAAKKADKPLDLNIAADNDLASHIQRGLSVGESVSVARTLAATPPNVANPSYLVSYCRKMATKVGLKFTVIDQKQAAKLNMGGLLAVGAAGSTPPAIITLEHKPRGIAAGKSAPVLIVGKAVTFDTGGYSIKPAASMDGMKYDKCGGMAVIGAMHAIASLKLPIHVIGMIPTAENMVSEKAYRPNDIVTFCNGVTSEITNTDAEGRLILSDALAYGTRTYKPQAVIDLATLTGGVVVALGSHMAGLFVNDTQLRDKLMTAGDFTGERLWRLPLWDEHRAQMKGNHADLINSANREASPIQGAAFLSFFIEPDGKNQLPTLPWAHIDIAGVADVKSEKGPFVTGPTGFGVRLLVRALENWTKRS